MKCIYPVAAVAVCVLTAGCSKDETPRSEAPAEAVKAADAPRNPYEAEVVKFRQDREATLKSNAGWLTIGGLWFLTQPQTTFGSDALNDIVFPESAPARMGTFELRNGKVTVKAAEGVSFQLNGKTITSSELRPDGLGQPDRVSHGDLQFWVHNSGDRLSIRLRDQNNYLRKEFVGLSWFPVDPAYKVDATYAAYEKPSTVELPNILGDIDRMPVPGIATFTLKGQEYKLEPVGETGDDQYWFIFRDLTSQKETYPAARFLYAAAPVGGKMTLDFNRTINPPCAYNPYTTCPLPTEQNRLRTRIEAGEKRYEGEIERKK
jgi:uncharacterized protein (DUF1684 family)